MQQITVTSNTFTPLIRAAAQQGSTTIYNSDSTHNIYLTLSDAGNPGTVDNIPLAPTQSVTVDGLRDVYAFSDTNTQPVAFMMPGVSSFFQRPNLANIGGISVFVQNTMPVGSPPVNSIWLDPSAGTFSTWNGSMWVQQQFDASQLLTAGTIIATLIAAGTIVGGIVNGTTITGALLQATGIGAEILAYNGTPAQDELIAAVASGTTSDTFGNSIPGAGLSVYGAVGTGPPYFAYWFGQGEIQWYENATHQVFGSAQSQGALQFLSHGMLLFDAAESNGIFFDTVDYAYPAIAPVIAGSEESWGTTPVVLQNGWAVGGNPNAAFRMRRNSFRRVELELDVSGAAATSSTVCTLPAGYRPSANRYIPGSSSAVTDAGVHWRIEPTGAVLIQGYGAAFTGEYLCNGSFALD